MKTKYVKLEDNRIIVFGEVFNHSDFSHFRPVSAGFVAIGVDKDGNPNATCYGKSVSLGLESDQKDSELVNRQILGHY